MATALQVGRASDNGAFITDRINAIFGKHAQEGLFRVTVLGWREFLAIGSRAGRGRGIRPRSDAECGRDFAKSCLFGIADLSPSAEQASALGCCLGGLLANLAQPSLKGCSVARRLRGKNG